MCYAVAIFHPYALYAETSSNTVLQLARSIVEEGKIAPSHYVERARILLDLQHLFKPTSYTRHIDSLDTRCNVAHLAEYLFRKSPTYHWTKSCGKCGLTNERSCQFLPINVNVILTKGFNYLQEAIEDTALCSIYNCKDCNIPCKVQTSYGCHVMFDTTVITDPNYRTAGDINRTIHTLGCLAKCITINDTQYILAGTVTYSNDHYVAYAYNGTTWRQYNDLTPKQRLTVPSTEIIKPHIIIYIKN